MASAALQRFVEAVGEIVARGESPQATVDAIVPLLRAALAEPELLDEAQRQPRADRYAQYPLAVAPDGSYSVVSFVWGAGQGTPVHDHLAWGLVGVYQGAERETSYARLDDGSDPTRAELLALEAQTHRPGDVSVLCPPASDIHRVQNVAEGTSISIHVYGTDIGRQQRHRYDLDSGAVIPFVSGYDTPPA
jgi:predicted metal-dependent enzyme (double-stranded beta helix superfamily)